MVEHAAVNRRVVGSSPTSGANSLLAHKKGSFESSSKDQSNKTGRFGPALVPL